MHTLACYYVLHAFLSLLPSLPLLHPHLPSPPSPSSILTPPSPRCSKVKEETATGTSSSTRVRTTLTLAVEGTEFDTAACMLRVKGRNVVENRFVKVGWSDSRPCTKAVTIHYGRCGMYIHRSIARSYAKIVAPTWQSLHKHTIYFKPN